MQNCRQLCLDLTTLSLTEDSTRSCPERLLLGVYHLGAEDTLTKLKGEACLAGEQATWPSLEHMDQMLKTLMGSTCTFSCSKNITQNCLFLALWSSPKPLCIYAHLIPCTHVSLMRSLHYGDYKNTHCMPEHLQLSAVSAYCHLLSAVGLLAPSTVEAFYAEGIPL